MIYPEFSKYKPLEGEEYKLVNAYEDELGNILIVEPGFYYGLENVKLRREEVVPDIMKKIDEVLKKEKRLILTGNFETPYINKENFIYKELADFLNLLNIYFEDKSRGSDYGD